MSKEVVKLVLEDDTVIPVVEEGAVDDTSTTEEESTEESTESTEEDESTEEESTEATTEEEEESAEEEESTDDGRTIEPITDQGVLSYLKQKTGKDIASLEDLFSAQTQLSDVVAGFKKFHEETGRGIMDYAELNKDLDKEDPDALIARLIARENPEFDNDDIAFEMKRLFRYDEDEDLEDEIRAKKIEKRKYLGRAKTLFKSEQEKYKAPLESREGLIPDEEREMYLDFKKSRQMSEDRKAETDKKKAVFTDKTNGFFAKENFKGFKLKVSGGKELLYGVKDVDAVRTRQMDLNNFAKNHINEEGVLKDAEKYHTALYVAENFEKISSWIFDQGVAHQVREAEKLAKNIPDGTRKPVPPPAGGPRLTLVDDDSNLSSDGKLRLPSR